MLEKLFKYIEKSDDIESLETLKVELDKASHLLSKRLDQVKDNGIQSQIRKYLEILQKFSETKDESLVSQIFDTMAKVRPNTSSSKFKEFGYSYDDVVQKEKVLFDYLIEKGDAKVVEKYLLTKTGLDIESTKQIMDEYALHLKEEGPRFAPESEYTGESSTEDTYEIEEFMALLGRADSRAKSTKSNKIYRSKAFDQYLLKAVCGMYGRWTWSESYKPNYGIHSFKDYTRHCLIKIHDEAYKQELAKESEVSTDTSL